MSGRRDEDGGGDDDDEDGNNKAVRMIEDKELVELVKGIEEIGSGPISAFSQSRYEEESKSDEDVDDALRREYLVPSGVSWDILDLVQEVAEVSKEQVFDDLLGVPELVDSIVLRFKRRGMEGCIERYVEEVDAGQGAGGTGQNSMSLQRGFGSKKDAVQGRSGVLPFAPGGVSMEDATEKLVETFRGLHRDADGLFDVPEGLERGLQVSNGTGVAEITELNAEIGVEQETPEPPEEDIETFSEALMPSSKPSSNSQDDNVTIDLLLPSNIVIQPNHMAQSFKKKNWAHMVDLNHTIDNLEDLVPQMAREWPFELDPFQKEAVYHLEQNDSVFVAAHTSAGKTVVAEYAIAMANRNMTKAIYTSPIKALSNQKFRDFKQDFTDVDVGLITGDVQINPTANCLIMTTEILRSMLYRGADLIRDVEFVIFDEVHYVNDIDRGVVWEEVIIMLPPHVKFILLSATVPNTFEFASWVGRTKHKDIYVISTPKRPIPLEIFAWAKGNLYKVVDSQRVFLEDGFRQHRDTLEGTKKGGSRGGRGDSRGGRGGRGDVRGARGARGGARGGAKNGRQFMNRDGPNKKTWLDLVQYLKNKDLLPAVVFVFSKKRCEEYVDSLTSVDFTSAKEKSEIHRFFESAMSRLKKEDRLLPQILKVREMAGRGVAVHHGGLLPIVKEVIEILFSKSLVKVLFATETFAMGLNLPTRTVVFSELRKHDGKAFRYLLPGEFTQMSGRAGRRGLDTIGTVIVMTYNMPLEHQSFKEVVLGVPTKLSSQFRLTYNMILNLLRIEALRVEEMIKRSFSENTAQSMLPDHMETAKRLEQEINRLEVDRSEFADESAALLQDLHSKFTEYHTVLCELIRTALETPALKRKFAAGRLVVFRDRKQKLRPGFIVSIRPKGLEVLLFNLGTQREDYNESDLASIPYLSMIPFFIRSLKLPRMEFHGKYRKVIVPYDKVELVTRNHASNDKEQFADRIKLLLKFQNEWNEVEWDGFLSLAMHTLLKRKEELVKEIAENPKYLELMNSPHFLKNYKVIERKHRLKQELKDMQTVISGQNLELLPDYESRLNVLKDLGFVDFNLNVQLKGRVACEINSGWELIVTELVLDNFLGDFEPEEIVALLSCFIYEGKAKVEHDEPFLTPRLEAGENRIKQIVKNVLETYQNHQVSLTAEEESFLERKRFALVNVVYEWARGMSFSKIMEISPESEGTIVRVITRLDEVCREVKNAALIIGNSSLHSKMTESQEKIKRDIVFCASLYL